MAKHRFVHLFLASAFWLSMGTMAYAQAIRNKTVTLSIKKAKLDKILKSIQQKSNTQILYNIQLVDKVAIKSIEANNEKLTDLLERLLKGTGLEYIIDTNVIIIRAKRQDNEVSIKVDDITYSLKSQTIANGTVKTSDGQPKAAVTVFNLETRATSMTDNNGNFSIPSQAGDRLQFSYIGFKPQRQTLKNLNALQVIMEPQEEMLDEVVLTGYQSIEKKLATGSIVTLKGKDVAEPNVPNIASMLQGKVPGLAVSTVSGSPNSIPRMRMRGTSTLIGNATPIWVIDGIVQENPVDVNPDNPLGADPSFMDKLLRVGVNQASADLMGNSIGGININDIENISFLKDAAATALYGTRAANGVILLTTKRGKAGRNIVNYNTSLGFVQRPSYSKLNLMDSKQRIQLSRDMNADGVIYDKTPYEFGYEGAYWDLINRRITQEEFNVRVSEFESQNTDWFKVLFRNSFNQTHSLSLSGGSDQTTYRASVNYGNNKGAAKKDGLTTVGGQLSLTSKLNKRLSIEFQVGGALDQSTGYNGLNPMGYALTTSRTLAPDLSYTSLNPGFLGEYSSYLLHFNMLKETEETGNLSKTSRFNGRLGLFYTLLPGLTYSSLFGGQISSQSSEQYATDRSYDAASRRGYDFGAVVPGSMEEMLSFLPFGGILNNSNMHMYHYSWRNMLTYEKRLFDDRDKISFNLGEEINSTIREGYRAYELGYLKDRGERFVKMPQYDYFNSAVKENKIINSFSTFATASYAFDQKYILDGSMRLDASNRFGQYTNKRFQPVWSISGRWNISDEPWLRTSKLINALDILASYGSQGHAVEQVGPDLILHIPEADAVNPLAKEYELRLKSLPYPDLRWEKTKSTNVQLHLGVLESLIDITASFYNKRTKDALTFLDIPLEYGIRKMIVNGGTITNKGWELALALNLIRKPTWSWSMSANTSKNYNALRTSEVDGRYYTIDDYFNGSVQLSGVPLNTFYVMGFKGLNPENGLPLFKKVDEVNDPTKLDKMEVLIPAGVKDPTLTGGIGSYLRYKNWSFNAAFSFGLGAHRLRNPLYSDNTTPSAPTAEQNMQTWLLDRWRKPGDELNTNIPSFPNYLLQRGALFDSFSESRYKLYNHSDIMLAKADYLKCRSMSLGYNVPANWLQRMKVSQASVALIMSNVFTLAGKEWQGQDPELPGLGTTALPQQPMYNLSINISF
ncbi:MAG: hypothetical protein K0R59_1625 [Sphingobacterium sp.]|jgi:TonB-linked SusC/RagA family outer membrane protein|nr:hypothetical protein [Sphingobacterium sp.]